MKRVLFPAVAGLVFLLCGCRDETAELPFSYPDAVIHASCGGTSSRTLVRENYGQGMVGDRKVGERCYAGGGTYENVEFRYDYVGPLRFVPLGDSATELTPADVYVFRIQLQKDGPWQTIPFVYTGGEAVAYDANGFRIWLAPDEKPKTGPAR